jgi:hypothetical protein
MEDININIIISGELHRDIRMHCFINGITMKSIIPKLIEEGLQVEKTIKGDITTADKKLAK